MYVCYCPVKQILSTLRETVKSFILKVYIMSIYICIYIYIPIIYIFIYVFVCIYINICCLNAYYSKMMYNGLNFTKMENL